jgi:hypothetical protein
MGIDAAASRRPLTMFASAASFGIAALVGSNTFVPTLSQASAAESQERNTPFSFNSQMEQFWRRFGMTDPRSDKWWQEDFSFPLNSQMEQFFRRFGRPDDARASRAWLGVQIQLSFRERHRLLTRAYVHRCRNSA